jgi:hypothetical protein
LTRDLDNGLDWLDVTQTMSGLFNRSYDDIVSQLGAGGEFEGFRHASVTELNALWVSAGIPDIDAGGTAANFSPVENLIMLIGNTSPNPVSSTFSQGLLANSNSPGTHQIGYMEALSGLGRVRSDQGNIQDDAMNLSGGHFLVRITAIPEPSALVTLTILLGVPLLRRHRRTLAKRSFASRGLRS